MLEDVFRTIATPSEGLYKEKGSKFMAYAHPVSSVEETKEVIDRLKKEFYDARHHCFAYMIGDKGEQYRAYDDGEPSHSAGDPILGQIKSKELTNTLVVVIRYFGGTKLGVGGLAIAYKSAAADALNNAKIIEQFASDVYSISFEYIAMNDIMKIIKDYDLKIVLQDFNNNCIIHLDVRKSLSSQIESILIDANFKFEII